MASYHLEALRRQRLIDRAHAAAHTVDHEVPAADTVQYTSKQGSQGGRESIRPKSASSIAQTMSATVEIGNDSYTVSRQTSRPASAISLKSSRAKSSRPTSAHTTPTSKTRSQENSIGSRKSSRPASASSAHTKTSSQKSQSVLSTEGRASATTEDPSEGTRSLSNSRATKVTESGTFNTAGKSRSTSAASKQSWSSRAEIRADEVRKELHKQELFLRDSNLVMGDIQVEEELQLNKKELQIV